MPAGCAVEPAGDVWTADLIAGGDSWSRRWRVTRLASGASRVVLCVQDCGRDEVIRHAADAMAETCASARLGVRGYER